MKFIPVEDISNKNRGYRYYRSVTKRLEEFLSMDVKLARIEFDPGEYCSSVSAYSPIQRCIKNNRYPINMFMFEGDIYLQRRDTG